MYETASTGSPAVPVVTEQTTDPTALSNAITAYNQNYLIGIPRISVLLLRQDNTCDHV
jgi:hypothetical protein